MRSLILPATNATALRWSQSSRSRVRATEALEMKIALVDSVRRPSVYPVPLLKIGAWRRDLGDECELFTNRLPDAGEFDEIWISTIFTFDIPHAMGLVKEAVNRCDQVRVGGIAATLLPQYFEGFDCDVHQGLLRDAEAYHPDYSLLSKEPKYSVTHTSRGCIRKCKFCMVHILEPEFVDRPGWDADLYPGAEEVLFYDNNWLAKPIDQLTRDSEMIRRLYVFRRISRIDFNQALDCRLLTEEKADLLKPLPIHPVRFAFDTMAQDGHYQDAIRMMAARGFRTFLSYVLYNYEDTPQDFYYRLKASAELVQELGIPAVDSFPMRYRPIMHADPKQDYVGPHWTYQKLMGFSALRSAHSGAAATITTHSHHTFPPVEEFEYWFGKDADEFDRLLSYPKVRVLAERRKGAMRLHRTKASL